MVIQKPGRGRPSRRFILEQVDLGMRDLARTGGLPTPVENAAIWRDIWYEEAHNSTAIEGNTLLLKEVKVLLGEGTGPDEVLTLTEVRHVHRLTVGPVWELFPPDHLDPGEGPGSFRRHDI